MIVISILRLPSNVETKNRTLNFQGTIFCLYDDDFYLRVIDHIFHGGEQII